MFSSRKWVRNSIFLVLIVLAIVLVVFFFRSSSDTNSVNVSTILADIRTDGNNKQHDTLDVGSGTITLTRGNGQNSRKEAANVNDTFDVTQVLKDNQIDYANSKYLTLQYDAPSAVGAWLSVLIDFIPFLLIGALLVFMMRQAQGSNNQAMSFGKSRARMFMGNKPTITFADVAGVEEAKQELQEIVEFLKYPEKFVALGARIPKGSPAGWPSGNRQNADLTSRSRRGRRTVL